MARLNLNSFSGFLSQSSFPSSNIFPIFQTKKHPNTILNYKKLETSIAHSTIEMEYKGYPERKVISTAKKKKKKKPRPSFFDQTREKWMVKTTSQRTKFPWQEQEENEKKDDDTDDDGDKEEVQQQQESSELKFSEEKGEDLLRRNFVKFSLQNRIISAPWAHGGRWRKSQLGSENILDASAEMSESFADSTEEKGLVIHGQGEKTTVGNIIEQLKDSEMEIGDGNAEKQQISMSSEDSENDGYLTSSIIRKLEEFKELDSNTENTSLDERRSDFYGNVHNFPDSLHRCDEEKSRTHHSGNGKLIDLFDNNESIQLPWERKQGLNGEKWKRSNTELAEKAIPEPELRRLWNVSLRMKERMKVGDAGITQGVVDNIHEKWKELEVVKIKFEGPPALNMKRTHEILEGNHNST